MHAYKRQFPSPGLSIIETLLDNNCSCGFQIEDSFDRATTASVCCDANLGRFDNWAPTIGRQPWMNQMHLNVK